MIRWLCCAWLSVRFRRHRLTRVDHNTQACSCGELIEHEWYLNEHDDGMRSMPSMVMVVTTRCRGAQAIARAYGFRVRDRSPFFEFSAETAHVTGAPYR